MRFLPLSTAFPWNCDVTTDRSLYDFAYLLSRPAIDQGLWVGRWFPGSSYSYSRLHAQRPLRLSVRRNVYCQVGRTIRTSPRTAPLNLSHRLATYSLVASVFHWWHTCLTAVLAYDWGVSFKILTPWRHSPEITLTGNRQGNPCV